MRRKPIETYMLTKGTLITSTHHHQARPKSSQPEGNYRTYCAQRKAITSNHKAKRHTQEIHQPILPLQANPRNCQKSPPTKGTQESAKQIDE